jgi:hypothetical protein
MIRARHIFSLLAAVLALVIAGCAGNEKAARTNNQPESIGVAWLEDDGTLVLQLRAESQGKAVGDALIRYKPADEAYARTLKHIGSLKPGETKPVPPWPEGGAKDKAKPVGP